MAMDYEVQRPTRRCAQTERELLPGETFYSVLVRDKSGVSRKDYSTEAWNGPPADALSWWKSQVPRLETKKKAQTPNEVMLQVFENLQESPDQQDLRYVLALLLARRRVLRIEEADPDTDASESETLTLHCARNDQVYHIAVRMPDEARANEIQTLLSQLLETGELKS